MTDFGRHLMPRWHLDPALAHLNHGSFGACPKEVLEKQSALRAYIERDSDTFFRHEIYPRCRKAADEVGAFINAPGSAIVFVPNTTTGVEAVLQSISWKKGDILVCANHSYNAVRQAVARQMREHAIIVRAADIALPMTDDGILSAYEAAMADGARLMIVDHINSPLGCVWPVEKLIAMARAKGAMVLVDGAHGIGQIDFDISTMAPDWYVSNAHKWLFAPKGSAFLYAAPAVQAITHPPVVSIWFSEGYTSRFDYVGTNDPTAHLVMPDALAFTKSLDIAETRAHRAKLMAHADAMFGTLKSRPAVSPSMRAAMGTWLLPKDAITQPEAAHGLMFWLREKHGVQVATHDHGHEIILRLSLQAYNGTEDIDRVGAALAAIGLGK